MRFYFQERKNVRVNNKNNKIYNIIVFNNKYKNYDKIYVLKILGAYF